MSEWLIHNKDMGMTAIVFSLFIIWKLIEELIRFRGIKKFRNINEVQCKWVGEAHKWQQDIRDNSNKLVQSQETMIKTLERIENNLNVPMIRRRSK